MSAKRYRKKKPGRVGKGGGGRTIIPSTTAVKSAAGAQVGADLGDVWLSKRIENGRLTQAAFLQDAAQFARLVRGAAIVHGNAGSGPETNSHIAGFFIDAVLRRHELEFAQALVTIYRSGADKGHLYPELQCLQDVYCSLSGARIASIRAIQNAMGKTGHWMEDRTIRRHLKQWGFPLRKVGDKG
jgi:hypothetical protein